MLGEPANRGDGKRASKTVNGVGRRFLYHIKAAVPKLLDDDDTGRWSWYAVHWWDGRGPGWATLPRNLLRR